jgi:tetratricopeptide (TPR) repeat protein
VLETEGPQPAIECFTDVLEDDPRNVVALTWLGWTIELSTRDSGLDAEQLTTLQETSERLIERAVAVDPRYSYARAFRAIVAYRRGDYAQAQEYLADFEANDPSADARAAIAQMDLEAGIERGLAGATGSSSSPGSSTTTTQPG